MTSPKQPQRPRTDHSLRFLTPLFDIKRPALQETPPHTPFDTLPPPTSRPPNTLATLGSLVARARETEYTNEPHVTPTWRKLSRLPPSSSFFAVMAVPERYEKCGSSYERRHGGKSAADRIHRLDHLRQAPFDWRVREEVHCDARCRSPPARFHHRTLSDAISAPRALLTT